jgi:4-amino-4-deoxy-L-arabinose transferase-like glycosyltransferase
MKAAPWSRWLPIIVLLLAFALRIFKLGDQNVWWDEAFSVWVTRHDIGTLTTIAAGDTHPPLYYWLLNPWMSAAGPSEFAIRFPSAMFGVIAVALVYRLGRHVTANRTRSAQTADLVGALAALLLATSRFHIWWSQEIRMYGLATMWAVASSLALLMALRTRTTRGWAAYLLTTIAGMYSLYLFAFVVAAQNVFILWWWLWRVRNKLPVTRHQVGGWIGIMLTVVLAMLPWMAYTLPKLKSWSAASQFSPLTYLQLYCTVLTLGITTFVERYWWVNLLVLVIIVAGVVTWRKHGIRNAQYGPSVLHLAACILLAPAIGVFVLLTLPQGLFYRPPLEARYQLLSVPALALVLAASITALWEWRKVAGGLAGVTVLALTAWALPGYYEGRYLRDDFLTMTRAIAAYAEPGDALLLVSGDRFPLFQFRYDVLPGRAHLPDVTTFPVVKVTPQDVERMLVPLAASHKRVWLAEVEKNLQDPDGLLAGWLDKNRNPVWREDYGYNRLSLYGTDQKPLIVTERMGDYPQQVNLGKAMLQGYDLPVREVRPGDMAHLVTYLKVSEPFTLTTSLVLMDDSDRRVLESRQEWVEPQRGLIRVRFDAPVYTRTPPGEYHFELSSSAQSVWLYTLLRIADTPKLETVTSVFQRDDQIGQSIRLAGFYAPTQVKPGGQLPVKLHWRTPDKIKERYTVFVQLVGAQHNPRTNGPLWAGHDSEPLDGGYPTTQWFVDTTIADTHTLTVPPDAPPGEYELWVGMYTQPDIKRLPVYDAQGNLVGDHVVLGKVMVTAK